MDSDNFVRTEGLTKRYSPGNVPVVALKDVDISIPQGQCWAITGPSGSGKSTLMNLLGGLDTPTSGRIKVAGEIISELNRQKLALYRRYQVGMIFQSFNLISSYTALENVALPLLFAGVNKKERDKQSLEMLDIVGLHDRRNHRPSELSGGEQQRVAIARALINRPKLLLADEPTGNLDSQTSKQILQILLDLNKNHNLSLIMISHEDSVLAHFGNNVISLCDGGVVGQAEKT